MSFVDGFYSFNIDLTCPDSGLYEKLRLKTPKHPDESLENLYARTIAWLHSYRPNLSFSNGYYAPSEPAIWRKDATERILNWIELGFPPEEKLRRAMRMRPPPNISIYFYEEEQVEQFCLSLRGSKSNWIEHLRFFRIEDALISALLPLSRSSSRWAVTILDDSMFLSVDGTELQSSIHPLDMWDRYQGSINNLAG